jgi:hypothetical protein
VNSAIKGAIKSSARPEYKVIESAVAALALVADGFDDVSLAQPASAMTNPREPAIKNFGENI